MLDRSHEQPILIPLHGPSTGPSTTPRTLLQNSKPYYYSSFHTLESIFVWTAVTQVTIATSVETSEVTWVILCQKVFWGLPHFRSY